MCIYYIDIEGCVNTISCSSRPNHLGHCLQEKKQVVWLEKYHQCINYVHGFTDSSTIYTIFVQLPVKKISLRGRLRNYI